MTTPTPLPGQKPGNESDDLDLRRYIGLFLSNWYWFALALFAALAIAYFINNYSERIYTVTASLLIKDDERGSDMSAIDNIMPGGNIFRSQQNLQNEIGILKSFSVNFRVMQELPDFHVTMFLIGRRGIAEHRYYRTAPFYLEYDSLEDQTIGLPLTIIVRSDNTFSIEANGTDFSKEEYSFGERIDEAGFDFSVVKYDPEEFRYDPDHSNKYRFWFNLQDRNLLSSEAYFLQPNDIVIIEPLKHKIFNLNLPTYSFVISTVTGVITTTLLLINYFEK